MLRLHKLYTANEWTGIEILKYDGQQNFRPSLVQWGKKQGFIAEINNCLRLHSPTKTLVYTIKTTPGYYCCFCAKKLTDSNAARQHVLYHYGVGETHTDRNNPAGYRYNSFYGCQLLCVLKPKG